MGVEHFSHLGLCVSDLERSLRFYRDALGFRERATLDVAGEPAGRLLDLEDVKLHAVYLEREGLRLELLYFASPGHERLPTPRPVNGLGLTHLSLRVSGMAALLDRVGELGGAVLEQSRIEPGGGTVAVFVTDPDGTRIELVEAPGDPSKLPGE